MSATAEIVLRTLKSRGAQSPQSLARQLAMTLPGVRRSLSALQNDGLVASKMQALGVGRPKRVWSLTDKAQQRFPDGHSFVTVELIAAVRSLYGDAGLDRLIDRREVDVRRRYQDALNKARSLREKVARLAELRSEEGYMAEWSSLADGALVLAENHCPICAAAKVCQGFCRSELIMFRTLLGPDVEVERMDHILAGARRCSYRIARRR